MIQIISCILGIFFYFFTRHYQKPLITFLRIVLGLALSLFFILFLVIQHDTYSYVIWLQVFTVLFGLLFIYFTIQEICVMNLLFSLKGAWQYSFLFIIGIIMTGALSVLVFTLPILNRLI